MIEKYNHIFNSYKQVFLIISILSIVALILSPLIINLILIRLPQDYFIKDKDDLKSINYIFLFIRNLIGIILIIMGLAMFVLPGQGLITFVIGMSLVDFPGKRKLFIKIVKNHRIQNSLNWFRIKSKKTPFNFPN